MMQEVHAYVTKALLPSSMVLRRSGEQSKFLLRETRLSIGIQQGDKIRTCHSQSHNHGKDSCSSNEQREPRVVVEHVHTTNQPHTMTAGPPVFYQKA